MAFMSIATLELVMYIILYNLLNVLGAAPCRIWSLSQLYIPTLRPSYKYQQPSASHDTSIYNVFPCTVILGGKS